MLLLAAFAPSEGIVLSPAYQATPTATLSPMERLAKPTLPPSAGQADHGAQDYWLYCLPCHGERGQGLTDEFRDTYPPEENYCWESGCHGKRPYENGFTLPMQIPALVGPGALQKFPTAANLRGYIFAAMPMWKPGSLTEEQSWQVTAFLLRQNSLWDAREELNASNADQVRVGPPPATPTPEPLPVGPPVDAAVTVVAGVALVLTLLLLAAFLRRRRES
jgi:cytochrome c